ncbi:hypothetical protein V1511DRAFT_471843 [Dipodascopsis uninucleata]
MRDYRGATVEDLDLPPAVTITPETALESALELSYEREFSYLPVTTSKTRSLIGYLSAEQLQNLPNLKELENKYTPDKRIVKHFMHKFTKTREFQMITLDTPLEELEDFFAHGHDFAVVTDSARRFVLGVAVPEDLQNFVKRRPSIA